MSSPSSFSSPSKDETQEILDTASSVAAPLPYDPNRKLYKPPLKGLDYDLSYWPKNIRPASPEPELSIDERQKLLERLRPRYVLAMEHYNDTRKEGEEKYKFTFSIQGELIISYGFCGFLRKMLWEGQPKSIEKIDPSATKYFCGAVHEISPLESHVAYCDILADNPLESGLAHSAIPTRCERCDLKNDDDFNQRDQNLKDQWEKHNASVSFCKWEKPKRLKVDTTVTPPPAGSSPIPDMASWQSPPIRASPVEPKPEASKDGTQEIVETASAAASRVPYTPTIRPYDLTCEPKYLRPPPEHKPELSEDEIQELFERTRPMNLLAMKHYNDTRKEGEDKYKLTFSVPREVVLSYRHLGFLDKMFWEGQPESIEKIDPSATKYFSAAVHEISPLEIHVAYCDILPAKPLESDLNPAALPTRCEICDLKNHDDFRQRDQDLQDQWEKYNASTSYYLGPGSIVGHNLI